MPLIPPQILAALVIAVAVAAFAAGWKTKGWQEDSQALAIAETREAAMQSAADAISRIKVVNTTVYQRATTQVIDRPVYRECQHQPDMMQQINAALVPTP